MMRLLIILPFLITFVIAQQDQQFINCQFSILSLQPLIYRCAIQHANVVNENLPIEITEGPHLDGRDGTHVNLLQNSPTASLNLRVLTRDIINHFPNLETVNFGLVRMERIAANAFESCGRIREVFITSNDLAVSALNGIFRNCQNLRVLRFTWTRFGRVFREMFTGLGNLETLDLTSNELSSLPNDVFADLTNLRTLVLDGNHFEQFSANSFAPLVSLEHFSYRGNFFGRPFSLHSDTFGRLINLRTLNLEQNALMAIPQDAFTNLTNIEEISLGWTQISAIESYSFGYHPNLIIFDMQQVWNFQFLDPRFFNQTPNLWEFNGANTACLNERVFNVSSTNFENENAFTRCIDNWNNRSSGSEKVVGSFLVVFVGLIGAFKMM